jgi:hypothetical protein
VPQDDGVILEQGSMWTSLAEACPFAGRLDGIADLLLQPDEELGMKFVKRMRLIKKSTASGL